MLFRSRRWLQGIPWLLFGGWFLLATLLLIGQIRSTGQLPVDYEAYHRAAEAIGRGERLYPSVEAAQQIWLSIHQYETDVLAGQVQVGERMIVGPYVYPPTLALWIARLGLNAIVFVILLLLSIYGFGWLWLKSSAVSGWWLLGLVGSLDVLGSLGGGNVELLLLFCTLLAAWLLWKGSGIWAAPVIALTLLVKPFYALFFGSFGLLLLAVSPTNRGQVLKTLVLTATAVIILVGLEILDWGADLRVQAADYLPNTLAYQWLVLPVSQQTPMSLWNRTALQGLVNAGMPASVAQAASLGLWAIMLGLTSGRAWNRRLSLAMVFALAFVMLSWTRPVGWGLPYLEVVMLVAVWPALVNHLQRGVLVGLALTLMLSHWLALIYTSQGHWLRLVTLQSAEFAWETWLVLPLCWALLLWAVPRLSAQVLSGA